MLNQFQEVGFLMNLCLLLLSNQHTESTLSDDNVSTTPLYSDIGFPSLMFKIH
jgi:hypothetical protein